MKTKSVAKRLIQNINFKKEAGRVLGVVRDYGPDDPRFEFQVRNFPLKRPDRLYGPASPIFNAGRGGDGGRATGFFPGCRKGLGVKLPTYLHLAPRLGMSGGIPPQFRYAFMSWTNSLFLPFVNYMIIYLVTAVNINIMVVWHVYTEI